MDTIRSISGQTHPNIEHIFIDGGSTDGTAQLINQWASDNAKIVSEHDEGLYDALNKGIRLATGDVIGFLHADDLLSNKNVIGNIVEAFGDAGVDAVYGDLRIVQRHDLNATQRFWRAGKFHSERLAKGWMPPHPTLYVRRKWFDRLGGFDTRYKISADYFFILNLFGESKFRPVYCEEEFVIMRGGGISNQGLISLLRKGYEDLSIIRRCNLGGSKVLFRKICSKIPQLFWSPR